MVTAQFTISIILIVGMMFYSKQLNFISRTANIDQNMVEINGNDIPSPKLKTFKNEITRLNGVNSGTISGSGFLNAWSMLGEDNVPILSCSFDSDFLKTHNFMLKSGLGFSENQTGESKYVIVNETFVRKFGIKDPIGKPLPVFDRSLMIKGVVADFYTESFTRQIQPTVIYPFNFDKKNSYQVLQLQLSGNGLAPTLDEIRDKWEEYFPDKIFSYTFICDEFNHLHSNYSTTARIIDFFTIISIFLTAFGLFGMTWYSVERRIKEIGIRKVNGAKIVEVMAMLNKDIIKWIAAAFIIAVPVAYYFMQKWLESFAYKTELSWWIFALAGILALGIALLTVSWQSWKAATRNPVEALRYE
jgi:putative ABC transport system permease protein